LCFPPFPGSFEKSIGLHQHRHDAAFRLFSKVIETSNDCSLLYDHITNAMIEIMHEIETEIPWMCDCSPEDVPAEDVAVAASAVAVGLADEPDDDS